MAAERSGSGDIGRTLQLLWNPEASSGRGRQRSLSVAAIVDKALELADERGLDAVSIRAVASELGVGAMTLYRYIPSKAELLDLMLDRVNRLSSEDMPQGWRPAIEAVARERWHLATTHRWLPLVDQTRPVLGPNAVHGLDLVMAAMHDSGLADQEKVALTATIDSFVAALARTSNSIATMAERTGGTYAEFWQSQEAALVAAMTSGRYPHMARLGEDAFAASMDEIFEFGLQRILDGVQAFLDARAPGTDGPSGPA